MTDFLRRLRRPPAPPAAEDPAPGGTPLPSEVAAADQQTPEQPADDAPTERVPVVRPPAAGGEQAAGADPTSGEQPAGADPTSGEQPAGADPTSGEQAAGADPTGREQAAGADPTSGEQAVGAAPSGAEQPTAERGGGEPGDATAPAPPAAVPAQDVPAGAEPVAGGLSFRDRGRLRRRLRFLRRVRELGFRDLGGLVFDQHRFGRRNEELVAGKLAALQAVDAELRALEGALRDPRPITELREPGISACPRCGALHGSEARFCPSCGVAFRGPRAVAEVGDAAHAPGPAGGAGAPPPAPAPAPSAPAWAASPPQPPHPATAPPAAPVPSGDDRRT